MGRKVPKGPRVISGELECPRQLLVLPPIIPGARQMLSPLEGAGTMVPSSKLWGLPAPQDPHFNLAAPWH